MNIVKYERTPEMLSKKVGNVQTNVKCIGNTLLLFALTAEEIVSAISFRPAIEKELEEESKTSESVALVWSKVKACLDSKAAMKAINDMLLEI